MKNFRKKLFVIGMALVMLVSTLGIAQVSHICKMALAGKENFKCESVSADKHACCQETTTETTEKLPTDSGCCKNVVKFYVIKVVSTLNQSFQIQQIDLMFFSLLIPNFSALVPFQNVFCSIKPDFPPNLTGKLIILAFQAFLI